MVAAAFASFKSHTRVSPEAHTNGKHIETGAQPRQDDTLPKQHNLFGMMELLI